MVFRVSDAGGGQTSATVSVDVAQGRVVPPGYELIEGQNLGGVRLQGQSYKWYRDCTFSGSFYVDYNSHHIVAERVTAKSLYITSAWDVSIYDSFFEPSGYVPNGNQVKVRGSGYAIPARLLIEGTTFRNYRKDPATSNHVDGLHFFTGEDVVVRRCSFDNNEAYHILFTKYQAPTPTRVTVEDCTFGSLGEGNNALALGGGHGEEFADYLVQRNTSSRSFNAGTNNTIIGNIRFLNNQAIVSGCGRAGVTCQGNL